MKKIVIASDSFKGTLSSVEVCKTISEVLCKKYSDIETVLIPIADGGEGTTDAYLSIKGGEKINVTVKSPLGNGISASYARLPDSTCVIETAAASGISIEKKNNALLASSFGTGQLVAHAIENGAKRLIIGLGGSATTDGGTGLLRALGARFLKADGSEIPFGGAGLLSLDKIDLSGLDKRIFSLDVTALCDVKNPLCGKDGSAFVFAPQKGASKTQVALLDKGLSVLSKKAKDALGKDFSSFPGAGAAGGLGFAIGAFLGGRLKSGIDCVLSLANFDEAAKSADLVITGEGKMDSQSFFGKAPFGVAKRSGKTKVIAVVGSFEGSRDDAAKMGISQIIETNPWHLPFEQIKANAEPMLKAAAEKIDLESC